MNLPEILSKTLSVFERYYTIKTENVTAPFDAEAEFRSHGEQYILVKAAKVADIDSNDFAYFKTTENLTFQDLETYVNTAWEAGLSNVKPYYGHRNSDVTVVIIAERLENLTAKQIKKFKLSKTYKLGMYGWSNFRLAILDLTSGKVYNNRLGDDLGKTLQKIDYMVFKKEENLK